MKSFFDTIPIFHYHRAMIAHYGSESSYALGWRDVESQQMRFKVLAGVGDLNNHSVLDVGCGYGDLLPYLLERYPNLSHYHGIEQIPELYDEALKRHGHLPIAEFTSGNFITRDLPVVDYVLASGSLNYGSDDDPDFIFNIISKLFANSKVAVAFNLLRQMPVKGLLVAYEPETILTYCKTLSNRVVFIDDYAEEDFTVYVYR